MSKKHRKHKRNNKETAEQKQAADPPIAERHDTLCQQDIGSGHEQESADLKKITLKSVLTSSGFYTALATVIIAWATVNYASIARKQLDAVNTSFRISQGAYITVGRKDGLIAEYIPASDNAGNGGIVIYFQNSGRMAAQFNWGLGGFSPGIGSINFTNTNATEILKSAHEFHPMRRTENLKDHSIGSSNQGLSIAAESVYETDVVEITRDKFADLTRGNNKVFLLGGRYESCDPMGNYSCRDFLLSYTGHPFDRFMLNWDMECLTPPDLPALPGFKDLPICEIKQH